MVAVTVCVAPAAIVGNGSNESEAGPNADETKLAAQNLIPGSDGAIVIQVDLPAGYHLNPAAPQRYRVSVESGEKQLGLKSESQLGAIGREKVVSVSSKSLALPLRIPFRTHEAGAAAFRVQLTLFYCREDNTGVCRIKTLIWTAPVEVANGRGGSNEIKLQGKLTAD